MHNVTTSRHVRSSSELMIMVPIKNEFVPITELVMTYASRISVVLQALAEIRQLKVERGFDDPIGPIERLQTIHRVQWTVIEPFDDVTTSRAKVTRQTLGPQVVLTSHFDSSWENYFHDLVTTGGPLLDLIFSHCMDYENFSCKDGFEAFSSFIRRHQRRCDFLYCTAPEVTIDDIRYFTRYSSEKDSAARIIPPMEVEALRIIGSEVAGFEKAKAEKLAKTKTKKLDPLDVHDERTRASLRVIQTLHDICERLFLPTGGLGSGAAYRHDQKLFEDAVASTLEREPELYRLGWVLNEIKEQGVTAPELAKAAHWIDTIVGDRKLDVKKPLTMPPPRQSANDVLRQTPAPLMTEGDIEALLADVQGNILESYPKSDFAKLVLLRCHDRVGLQRVLTWAKLRFTSERDSRNNSVEVRLNLGVTAYGVRLLELPPEVIEQFPREFREGMEERAGLLGDVAHNHPKNWRLPFHSDANERAHLSTIHVALVLQGTSAAVARLVAELKGVNAQGETISTLDLRPSGNAELSQPKPPRALRTVPKAPASALDHQALGEFILGYENAAGETATCAVAEGNQTSWASLFKNGSFMAVRKMTNDQAAFDSYIDGVVNQALSGQPLTDLDKADFTEEVKALIIGRRPRDGRMLGVLNVSGVNGKNDFDFSHKDADVHCPRDSHIRRANPRELETPRIARRSLPYGPEAAGPEHGEQGLLFMACCASLANQYEIVQRWVNGGNSTGLPSRVNDLAFGAPFDARGTRSVSLAATRAAKFLPVDKQSIELPARPMAAFVTSRWGMYLFMPSLTAIYRLCEYIPQPRPELAHAAIKRGKARIKELNALPPTLRTHEWKRLLEEVPEADGPQALHARDVAAAITHAGGAVQFRGEDGTGAKKKKVDVIVVTKADLANTVLSRSERFSVKEYRVRLKNALDDHYLGYDKDSRDEGSGLTYEAFSMGPNEVLRKLADNAESDTQEIAARLLDDPKTLELDPDGRGLDRQQRSSVSVRDLALAVIGELCHKWLAMPGEDGGEDTTRSLMNAVERLLVASRYCFQSMPIPFLEQTARRNQSAIMTGYRKLSSLDSNKVVKSVIGQLNTSKPVIKRLSITVLLGAVGFAPTAVAATTRILDYWMETEKLWQIQRRWLTQRTPLLPEILEALSKVPSPPTLYRIATAQAGALGAVKQVPENALVIVNLAAVYEDAVKNRGPVPEAWFFGGEPGGAHGTTPQHGCPGRQAGLIVIQEIIKAVLARSNLRRERRGLLSYDRNAS
jgi:deferrochelatase/peroxidase EfeB